MTRATARAEQPGDPLPGYTQQKLTEEEFLAFLRERLSEPELDIEYGVNVWEEVEHVYLFRPEKGTTT